jgi:hypothetical protein
LVYQEIKSGIGLALKSAVIRFLRELIVPGIVIYQQQLNIAATSGRNRAEVRTLLAGAGAR